MVGSDVEMGLAAIVGAMALSGIRTIAGANHYRAWPRSRGEAESTKQPRAIALAKQQHPGLTGIDKQIGLALFQAKAFERAIPVLMPARASEQIQVLLALARPMPAGQTDSAQAVFADLLQRHPDSPELHLLWGEVYASVSQNIQAEQEFRDALRANLRFRASSLQLGIASSEAEPA